MESMILIAQQNDDGGGFVAGMGALMCLFVGLGIVATAFWIWMLVDALMNEPTTNEKILWVLVIVFLHVLGALIYFFIRRQGRRRSLA